jgi:hypothetical protein
LVVPFSSTRALHRLNSSSPNFCPPLIIKPSSDGVNPLLLNFLFTSLGND